MPSQITVAGAVDTKGSVNMTFHLIRLLGFAPLVGLDALQSALEMVPGPALRIQRSAHGQSAVAAIAQDEPETALQSRSRDDLVTSLRTVQRRMEIACLAGPFLPMDPATACCLATTVPQLLEPAWDGLFAALTQHGACHQWDIALRWTPNHVMAKHRHSIAAAAGQGPQILAEAVAAALRTERDVMEAGLLATLRPVVLAFAAAGAARAETEISVTVLTSAQGETALEAALDALAPEYAEAATIDMRGPLPPLSFSAVQLITVTEHEATQAWQTLGLSDRIDLATLHRQWRLCAAAIHPDRQATQPALADCATVSEITSAYRLLRGLLPNADPRETFALTSLLRRCGSRLILPAQHIDHDRAPSRDCGSISSNKSEPMLEILA